MPEAKHITGLTPYASSGDFHRIFNEEKDALYRLSFLLTADREKARQCFVSGLEDSVKGNRVFKEWAQSWARRAIIQNAVRVVKPRPMKEDEPLSLDDNGKTFVSEPPEIAAILELRPFERFVFVMSVLEHYSEHECSILLNCSRRDLIAAQSRARQQIGSALESHAQREASVGMEKPELHDDGRAVFEDLLHI